MLPGVGFNLMGGGGVIPTFPIVVATNTSDEETVTTDQTVALPAGIEAGDLLFIAMIHVPSAFEPRAAVPSGWTALTNIDRYAVFYKEASGSEGSTVTVTLDNPAVSAHNTVRIAKKTWVGTPEETNASGSNASPNPPSETASWGTDKNLWIAFGSHWKGAQLTITAAPTNFTGFITRNADHDATASDINQATAFRDLEASVLNPGSFTSSSTSSSFWYSSTVVVRGIS